MTSDSSPPRPAPEALTPSPEQRRQAAMHFDRAGQLIACGSHDHGIRLLRTCCRLDPANLLYRQALRRAEKAKFANNLKGGWLAWLFSWPVRARLRVARGAGRYLDVLHLAERILARNPWDVPAQLEQVAAAEALDLTDLAVWTLEQARHKEPYDPDLNRRLARLYQKRGNFTQAHTLWELVLQSAPQDEEARRQMADLPGREVSREVNQVEKTTDPLEQEAETLRSRIQEDPTQPAGYRALARLYRLGGRHEQAHGILLEGLAATGQAFELTVDLADLQIDPFREDLAITRQKLSAHPDENLRQIEYRLLREINTRELDLFRLLADRFPGQLGYRYEVGVRLMRLGQIDEAIEEMQAVRVSEELRGEALAALGWCYRSRNNFRQAQRHYEEALNCLPAEPAGRRLEVLYELARCHAELGELPRAVDLAGEVVRFDPGHRDMASLLVEWQVRAR